MYVTRSLALLTATSPTDARPSDVVDPSSTRRKTPCEVNTLNENGQLTAASRDAVAPSSTGRKQRCEASTLDENAHLHARTPQTDQYRFLHSIRMDCLECVEYWLEAGIDPCEGTSSHPEWTAISWAEHFNAQRLDRLWK